MQATEITGEDGRTWRIRFNMAALGWFERQTGIRVMNLEDGGLEKLWLDEMAWLFAAGLHHENHDVTMDDGYELLDSLSSEQAQKQMMNALRRDQGMDLPEPEDADEQPKKNGTAKKNVSGTGTGSRKRQPASG